MRWVGSLGLAVLLASLAPAARSAVSAEEAARLEADLTPMGAERASPKLGSNSIAENAALKTSPGRIWKGKSK